MKYSVNMSGNKGICFSLSTKCDSFFEQKTKKLFLFVEKCERFSAAFLVKSGSSVI